MVGPGVHVIFERTGQNVGALLSEALGIRTIMESAASEMLLGNIIDYTSHDLITGLHLS